MLLAKRSSWGRSLLFGMVVIACLAVPSSRHETEEPNHATAAPRLKVRIVDLSVVRQATNVDPGYLCRVTPDTHDRALIKVSLEKYLPEGHTAIAFMVNVQRAKPELLPVHYGRVEYDGRPLVEIMPLIEQEGRIEIYAVPSETLEAIQFQVTGAWKPSPSSQMCSSFEDRPRRFTENDVLEDLGDTHIGTLRRNGSVWRILRRGELHPTACEEKQFIDFMTSREDVPADLTVQVLSCKEKYAYARFEGDIGVHGAQSILFRKEEGKYVDIVWGETSHGAISNIDPDLGIDLCELARAFPEMGTLFLTSSGASCTPETSP